MKGPLLVPGFAAAGFDRIQPGAEPRRPSCEPPCAAAAAAPDRDSGGRVRPAPQRMRNPTPGSPVLSAMRCRAGRRNRAAEGRVWNRLTGRAADHGVNDYDLAYCDPSDLSAAGEAAVIDRAARVFAGIDAEVEVCNQARVPLWFGAKYGVDRKPIHSTEDAVKEFASVTHSVAIRLDAGGRPELIAPLGLEELFSLVVKPVPDISTPAQWNAKIARHKALWPEIEFLPAPE